MNTFTIELTDSEFKALSHVAYSPQEWIENAVKARCHEAMEQIFKKEVTRMLADPEVTSITADRDAVVLAADIKTAKEIHEERMLSVSDTVS